MSILDRRIRQDFVFFSENSSESVVTQVGDLVRHHFRILNARNFDLLKTTVAPDAVLDSIAAGGQVAFVEYCLAMKERFKIGHNIFFEDVLIKMVNQSQAEVSGTLSIMSGMRCVFQKGLVFFCNREAGCWLIKESKYAPI